MFYIALNTFQKYEFELHKKTQIPLQYLGYVHLGENASSLHYHVEKNYC